MKATVKLINEIEKSPVILTVSDDDFHWLNYALSELLGSYSSSLNSCEAHGLEDIAASWKKDITTLSALREKLMQQRFRSV